MPPPKLPQPSGAVHSIWWLGFFFDLFYYSGLRAFFTSYFTNCTTDYAPPQITPTIRCCSKRLMVGIFFLTSSLILDLEHFSQVILWIILQIMPLQIDPTIRCYRLCPSLQCCSQHLMVGFFFLISSPILDLEHFSQVIYELYYRLCPPAKLTQPSGAVHSIWWLFFFFTSSPILDLEHFSQVILRIVLQIMPPTQLPQPSGAVQSIWWLGFFFFDLFSYSGLRAFFTSYFMNCTTDYAPPN